MSTPIVPPRPQRNSQHHAGHAGKTDTTTTPLVPPRPVRKTDPTPDHEARSPLNFPPTAMARSQVSKRTSQELPRRPPSVSLPTLGHEGEEYSSFDHLPAEAQVHASSSTTTAEDAGGEQTRNVAADLPMHQPRASVPQSTATKNIQKVTDTDSISAAAAGIGRARPADDVHKLPPGDASPSRLSRVTSNNPRRAPSTEPPNALRAKASFNRSSSSLQPLERTTSRPGSLYGGDDAEHGIPEIGKQVPLLAMAGDVQMPTPGPGVSSVHAPGIGFFNDGSSRSHHRKRSSRHEFGPPDSYGIRHDQDHQDQFEREWVKKHPEEAAKEGYYNYLPKPETALSSEQLNRIVFGDGPAAIAGPPGTPGEEDAIEEYLSRVSTPAKVPTVDRKKRSSSDNVAPESPLRHSFATRLHPNDALEGEDLPRAGSKFHFDSDHEHEHADGTPILAADELMKRPSSAFMHAAVVPEPHADDDHYYDSDHHTSNSRRNSAQPHSRPSSRPSSVHGTAGAYTGGSLHRFISREEEHHSGVGTPLEEIEEYEPLFPEGEDGKKKAAIQKTRPDLGAMHHFPSQDVWEDTPLSLQYSATVSTPELERMVDPLEVERPAASSFETPEQEQARRTQNPADMTSDRKTFVKPHFKPGVLEELHESHRPLAHRFPSSDVWEDTPSSMYATTTVSAEMDDTRSPPDDRPTTMAIPGSQDDDTARATTGHGLSARPSIPSRPERKSKLAQEVPPNDKENQSRAPGTSDKPKPSIPARPQRLAKPDQGEGASLEKTLSGGSDEANVSPSIQKAKPAVPARPTGSKIAALQAGFMNDLNNRLKLGPQGPAPKKEEAEVEEEAEKQPLVDARKSRARGPPRRKPAASPASDRKSSATFAFSPLITVWTIDEEDELKIHSEDKENKSPESTRDGAEQIMEENEKHNTESAAPAENASDIASKIVQSPDPGAAAAEHHSSQGELEIALAEAGAGPAPISIPPPLELESPEQSKMTSPATQIEDEQVQTGESDIKSTQPTGEVE